MGDSFPCLGSSNETTENVIDPTKISTALSNDFVIIKSVSYWFETDAWNKFRLFFEVKAASFVNRWIDFKSKEQDINTESPGAGRPTNG